MNISIESMQEHALEAMRSCSVDLMSGRYTMAAVDRGIAVAYESMLIDSKFGIEGMPAEYHDLLYEWFKILPELRDRDSRTFQESALVEGSENK